MSYSLKRRLLHAFGATSLGPIITVLIQLVNVPVFLHFWGAKLYGEWLIISAVPVYFGLTDFGMGGAAGNEMTMQVARGEKHAALEVFQSTWFLTTVVSLSFTFVVGLAIWILPVERWLKLQILSRDQVTAILSILCLYILLDLQWNVIVAGFRCDGNYALGQLIGSIVRLATNAGAVISVALHGSPIVVAGSLFAFRLIGNWIGLMYLRRKSPWLRHGYRYASTSTIRRLFKPGVAYLAIPAGNAFILQGITVVVGSALGPIAVVIFTTTRTLTRFVYQIADLILNSVWVELSAAIGAGNFLLARNLHRVACQASLGLSSAAVLFLAAFGRFIFVIWTHHNLVFDQTLFYILLFEVLVNAFWYTSSVVPISCNRHARQSFIYVIATAASLPVAYVLMKVVGLPGAGISLLLVDVSMSAYVLNNSLALLDDHIFAFSRALFRAPSLASEVQVTSKSS